eukprot:CAMPEP_0119309638 /NCGR_PEP_ID=MMETSP1333-20130426/15879_1 /TAXON_ID=418940 /ORGANISM="Scyphosphaera apsteinii, Strain RCC1455" /LENGTH=120 /DNA_ID=CAMNT_0007313641 /DNA_START=172 /DNA_END=534 /DNA_ORIENTATION=-
MFFGGFSSAPKKAIKKVTKKVAKKVAKKVTKKTAVAAKPGFLSNFFLGDALNGPQDKFGYDRGTLGGGFRELLAPRPDFNAAKWSPDDLKKRYEGRLQKTGAPPKKLGNTFPTALMPKQK